MNTYKWDNIKAPSHLYSIVTHYTQTCRFVVDMKSTSGYQELSIVCPTYTHVGEACQIGIKFPFTHFGTLIACGLGGYTNSGHILGVHSPPDRVYYTIDRYSALLNEEPTKPALYKVCSSIVAPVQPAVTPHFARCMIFACVANSPLLAPRSPARIKERTSERLMAAAA